MWASVDAAPGLQSRVNGCGSRLSCLGQWDLPGSGRELASPASPAEAGGAFTTEL